MSGTEVIVTAENFSEVMQNLIDMYGTEKSFSLFCSLYEQMEKTEFSIILKLIYDIYHEELTCEKSTVFDYSKNINFLTEMFYRTKFLLRRYDFGFNSDNQFYEFYIREKGITLTYILKVIDSFVIYRELVLNRIAVEFLRNKCYSESLRCLKNAFMYNPEADLTKYNLAVLFYNAGCSDMALKYLEMMNKENEEAVVLRKLLEDKNG